jgi:hypothetical protein
MWGIKVVTSLILVITIVIIALPIIGMTLQCEEHDIVTMFSFQPYNSTADSSVKSYCKNCNNYFGRTRFGGTPEDVSYLDVVKEYIDKGEIVGGEYYTMCAIVSLGDYSSTKTKINCGVETGNILVYFSVEFREEFEEQVDLIVEGDEIVFRGRLYDEGFGFTDCELINN